jgi:phosphoenolpyruvate-protein kinase (PTS system EI component)
MGAPTPRDGRRLAAYSAAEGIAVGRSLRFARASAGAVSGGSGTGLGLREAVAQVRHDLEQLIRALPADEAQLFEPEAYILDDIEPRLLARCAAGLSCEDAVIAETSCGCTDLIIDVRMRLLSALEGSTGEVHSLTVRHDDDLVLVTDFVTPSLVASLPRQVRGLISAFDGETGSRRDLGRTSHAAILARGRGLPIAYVSRRDLASIADAAWLVIDAGDDEGTAHVWVDPGEDLLASARRRHVEDARARLGNGVPPEPLAHLGVDVRVNVASPNDEIPAAADGIGLVRTELMFAERLTAPSESEQLGALLLIGAKARGRPVVVRLFDAGGDKPLAWLGSTTDPSRGIGRLLLHPHVLATQLRALARAREHADIRVLLPFVRSADEVNVVRSRAAATLPLGAMVESPDAVDAIDLIASAADFVSVGTNDLTATVLGLDRTMEAPLADPRVLLLVRRAIAGAQAQGRKVTICGEMAGDDRGARISVGLGADALSVAPSRLVAVRAELGRATRDGCRAEAQAAIEPGTRSR